MNFAIAFLVILGMAQASLAYHSCYPVDGKWSSWKSTPGQCSKSCGGGLRYRTRTCEGQYCGGKPCYGESTSHVVCNNFCCPVDGYFTKWTTWSSCTKTCGGGKQRRSRRCEGRECKGKRCFGDVGQTRDCNKDCCPVDGQWSSWKSTPGQCSKSCEGGQRLRWRKCEGRYCGGKYCYGPSESSVICNNFCCPVNGYFTQWSEWGKCSKKCGGGIQRRSRRCEGKACGGKGCFGNVGENRPCNEKCCPVDGQWSSWKSTPGQCSKSCGGGLRYRRRTCEGQYCYGKPCYGESTSHVVCNNFCCPKDGYFTSWSSWGRCSKKCGGGKQRRSRRCEGRECKGKGCFGPVGENRDCNTDCCPVDGKLTKWGSWQKCSVTCGQGTQLRDRSCIKPECGGKYCADKDLWERRPCYGRRHRCPYNRYG